MTTIQFIQQYTTISVIFAICLLIFAFTIGFIVGSHVKESKVDFTFDDEPHVFDLND